MIKRELYLNRIRGFMNKDIVKVLTGIRRCGKSVMLELIQNELRENGVSDSNLVYLNFEDLQNAVLCDYLKLHEYISEKIQKTTGKVYIFLDEIQEVPAWEKCINSLRVKFDVDIYVTGSNAKLLSGELATVLAGRYVEIVIYPFSFAEFMEIYRNAIGEITVEQGFRDYLHFGGMPFLSCLNYAEEPAMLYLKDVYNSVVLKDIMLRNKIRDADMLQRVILYIFANIGRTFSATSMSKYFKSKNRKINTETIVNYIKACEDSFLVYRAPRQDLVGKKILSVNEKYFVADHGLRQSVYGNNSRDIEIVLENIVYIELLRRGYQVTIGKADTQEVDFVAERNGDRQYFQVCYMLASEEKKQREFGVLERIHDNFPKFVLSMDEFDMGYNGYQHMNIREFLLKEDS